MDVHQSNVSTKQQLLHWPTTAAIFPPQSQAASAPAQPPPGGGGGGFGNSNSSAAIAGSSYKQFPNGTQLNQMWMDSLAKGMSQMKNNYNSAFQSFQMSSSQSSAPSLNQGRYHPPLHQRQHQNQSSITTVASSTSAPVIPVIGHHQQQNQQQQQAAYNLPLPVFDSSNNNNNNTTQSAISSSSPVPLPPFPHPTPENQEMAEDERKRKNREFAKRSREKRKNEQKLLEEELAELQRTNGRLRQLVKQKIPNHAQSIFKDCCADHPLHHAAKGRDGKNTNLACSDFHLLENLIRTQQSFCLTDPSRPDNPIVYASQNFYDLTGYTREETLGRNCRFLQGQGTDQKSVALIRENIKYGRDTSVNLLNYKADGTPFWNQFFIAALRDRNGKIVNYVGVQCEIEEPKDEKAAKTIPLPESSKSTSADCIRIKGPADVGGLVGKPDPLIPEVGINTHNNNSSSSNKAVTFANPLMEKTLQPLGSAEKSLIDDILQSDSLPPTAETRVDWSVLAGILEDDFREGFSGFDESNLNDNDSSPYDKSSETDDTDGDNDFEEQPYHTFSPRAFVTKTCRSELVDSLLAAGGDVTNARFLKALEVLSSIYASSWKDKPCLQTCIDNFLNGSWVSLSRPAYKDCLGKNDWGDYMYTLGKMSFNMFKPGNLKCSLQHTLNKIEFAGDMDEAPATAVPWSLRRELAMVEPTDEPNIGPKSTVRSYDIEIALTLEPEDNDDSKEKAGREIFPNKPLRALQVVNGYLLQDPDQTNRLTVWFTGGKLSPVLPQTSEPENSEFGDFEDWKSIFDQEHKNSWSDSLKNIGAKLFLGAELPRGMEEDGSMSYSLNRPFGGHGKSYIEILYLDEVLFISRGNHGTIHVGVQSNLLCPLSNQKTKKTEVNQEPPPQHNDMMSVPNNEPAVLSNKRKVDGMLGISNNDTMHQPLSHATTNDMSDPISSDSVSWRNALSRDLEIRHPAFVAQDLNEVLANYGLEVTLNTKRLKPN